MFRTILAALFLLGCASAPSAPSAPGTPDTPSRPEPSTAPLEPVGVLRGSIAPGASYTVNFVSGPDGSDVAARFSTDGGPVRAMAVTHPRSDLAEQGGAIEVRCPGLEAHPMRVSAASDGLSAGSIHSNSSERGHFGFVFLNSGTSPVEIEVRLEAERSPIATTLVGLLPTP